MYECHITLEPQFGDKRELISNIVYKYGFKLAKLMMQKRAEDTPEESKFDTFCTSHNVDFANISNNMELCCLDLIKNGFAVKRYKIEDIVLDSRNGDFLELIR